MYIKKYMSQSQHCASVDSGSYTECGISIQGFRFKVCQEKGSIPFLGFFEG